MGCFMDQVDPAFLFFSEGVFGPLLNSVGIVANIFAVLVLAAMKHRFYDRPEVALVFDRGWGLLRASARVSR